MYIHTFVGGAFVGPRHWRYREFPKKAMRRLGVEKRKVYWHSMFWILALYFCLIMKAVRYFTAFYLAEFWFS